MPAGKTVPEEYWRELRRLLGRPSPEAELWRDLSHGQRTALAYAAGLSVERAWRRWDDILPSEQTLICHQVYELARIAVQLRSMRRAR